MGNMFANKKPATALQVEDDFIGGGGVLDSDIYPATIKYAYISKAQNSDAHSLNICLLVNGKIEVTRPIWMTNREGNVTRINPKTKKEENLRGYNQVNSLCMLLASKDITEMEEEEKIINLYDFESQKEIPQTVKCFVELHGCDLQVAIQKQIIDKTAKNEQTNTWEPTGETRTINEFIKFYPADRRVTLSEIARFIESLGENFEEVFNSGNLSKAINKMGEDNGVHATEWLKKNRGEVYDRSKGKTEGKSFAGKKSSGSGSTKTTKTSLFDD